MKNTEDPVIIEQLFAVSKERLWSAITEAEQMTQWFFEPIRQFEPQVGFTTRFVIENDGRIFPHLWTIIEVIPHKKIIFNWKYEGYAGDSTVTFELIDHGAEIKLQVTHEVLKSFSETIPEFTRENCASGWGYFIKERLPQYLE